jgi:hypothetical protein
MRFQLRTLMIATMLGPPLLAMIWLSWPIILAFMAYGVAAAAVLFGVSALLSGQSTESDA